MKKTLFVLTLSLCFFISQAQEDVYFISTPSLNPDGTEVIFTYDGDLWKIAAAGGTATRLTAMAGNETYPRVSPDGNWIAFSSTQYGNADVYVMPYNGGDIKRLTFNSSNDQVETWSWDSETVYFQSNRYNSRSAYTINRQGGTPSRLFEHFFNRPHNLAIHPEGAIYFNESSESSNQVARKRYQGPFNPDIKSYDLKRKEYKQHTTYLGKDMWASIDRQGKVYFASDEVNGEYNLYTLDGSGKLGLTQFGTSIKTPQVNANGGKVVFEKDYQLYIYDTNTQKSQKVNISIFQNSTLAQVKDFNTKGNISAFDVSPDEKKLAFISRGELFVSDIGGKFIKQLQGNPKERITEVKWLKDNQTLLYTQTVNGYTNVFTRNAATDSDIKELTKDDQSNRNLELNAERTKATYLSGINEVRLMDLESLESQTIANEELWGPNNPQPRFSPDGAYIAFTVKNDFEEDIYLYHIASKELTNYTQTGVTETSPFWGPDGKYLYFVSNRIKPSYPFGLQDGRVYRVALARKERDFKSDELEKVFQEENKEDKKEKTTAAIAIDFDQDILRSLERISPNFGTQSSPYVVKSGNKTHVIYRSNHDENQQALWITTLEPFEDNKTEKINGSARAGGIVSVGKNHYAISSGAINKINLTSKKLTPIETSFTFRRSLSNEFEQMYYETWAGIEENFYNETFHGQDWGKLRTQYAQYLPYLKSRAELRVLLNDMLGELNSSHMGFRSGGPEERSYYNTNSLNLGVIFSNENPYEIAQVVNESPADFADKNIVAGDVLTSINGKVIDKSINREFYLSQPSIDEEVTLGLTRGKESFEVKIHPASMGALRTNLYDEWIETNQKRVDEATKDKVAYVHMKNMSGGALQQFLIEMTSEGYNRDALILDLRYNTGGNVHDEVLKFLAQKPYLQWKFREGKLTTQGNFGAGAKPMVLLINEQSLSDAEMTTAGFKELGLGTVIGTETYRWIIFTSGNGLVDGSFYRLPSWGCYTMDGKNLEKEGVQPDINVDMNFDDRVNGRDPQLDRAIEEVMKQLKN